MLPVRRCQRAKGDRANRCGQPRYFGALPDRKSALPRPIPPSAAAHGYSRMLAETLHAPRQPFMASATFHADGPRPGQRPTAPISLADLSADDYGRFREVRAACHFRSGTHVCTRAQPLARSTVAAAAASLPRPLTHDAHGSSRPVCHPVADVGFVEAPPQRGDLAAVSHPWRPLTGLHRSQRPPHARAAGRRGPRRLWQRGGLALRAWRALGGRCGLRNRRLARVYRSTPHAPEHTKWA